VAYRNFGNRFGAQCHRHRAGRNVLLYFDAPTKQNVLKRMARAIAPDGYFIMGAAETVVGLTDAFVPHDEHRSINILRSAARSSRAPSRMVMG